MSGHKLLHLEGNSLDAELVAAHLRREGREDEITVVKSADAFARELSVNHYDVLLCDYSFPGFDAISAIDAAKKVGVPAIIVSGAIGEEKAVEIIKKGAFDYIPKSQLFKLSTSIDRAIAEARASKEYLQLQTLYKTLVESSQSLIFKMNTGGEIIYANEKLCEQFQPCMKIYGVNWLHLFDPYERSMLQNKLEQAIVQKKAFQKEGHLVSGAWVNGSFTPLFDEKQKIVFWIGMMMDITYLKKAEEESCSKSLFLAQMSHELRIPLTTILGYCDFLYEEIQEELQQDPSKKEWFACLEKIKISGEYLVGMLSNLLNLSEIEAGKITLHPSTVFLRDFYNKLIAFWEEAIAQKNQNLEWYLDPNLPDTIFIDEIRFQQILMNLLSNAVKYTDPEKNIKFIVQKENNLLVSIVSNEGEPLSDVEQEHIFEAFYRGENRNKSSKIPGLGLGLMVTKMLCGSFGGSIRLNCEQGWVNFIVKIPLHQEKEDE